jgi:pyruvate kinase
MQLNKVALLSVRPSHVRAISSIKSMLKLDWERPSSGDRKSKIVCTVGPATDNPAMLSSLLTAGMNCMRLNFSHGSHEHKARLIEELRGEVGKFRALGPRAIDWTDGSNEQLCAILGDTKGPEIRTGLFAGEARGGEVAIAAGDRLRISTDPAMAENGDETCLWADHPTLDTDLEVGQLVFLDDGLLQLEVVGHVSRAGPSVAAASSPP